MQTLLEPFSKENPLVYLDIAIGKEFAGRLIIELRKDVVPRTAENFRCLCTGEKGIGTLGKLLHYKGLRFHKAMRMFAVLSGDVVNNDGTSGESIYGLTFEDENFTLPHEEGVVAMVNYGKPNTNNSQFCITSIACVNLTDSNVVVGKILRGFSIIAQIDECAPFLEKPNEEIVIVDCGELKPGQDWGIHDSDETNDTLPPYPMDWEDKMKAVTLDEVLNMLVNIRYAGNHYFGKQKFYEARRKYRKANRYHYFYTKLYDWKVSNEKKPTEFIISELDKFFVINNINMATVELKLNELTNAVYLCTEALQIDPEYSKALYKRGQAHIGLRNYENAIIDLKRAHQLIPGNVQILNELNRAIQLLSAYYRQQGQALKKLFQ